MSEAETPLCRWGGGWGIKSFEIFTQLNSSKHVWNRSWNKQFYSEFSVFIFEQIEFFKSFLTLKNNKIDLYILAIK